MKILPVSFSLSSKGMNANVEHPFLYTAKEFRPNKHIENFNIYAGILALVAVGITLFNIGVNKKPTKNVFMV